MEQFLTLPFQPISIAQGGERLIRLQNIWGSGNTWPSLDLANHNLFRLDVNNRVVWQVRRVENSTHANWEILHELAKRKHAEGAFEGYYTADGYMDPFFNMGLDESGALDAEPAGTYRPGCKVYLTTHWWSYELDVETGIATCTGNQVK